MKFAYVIVGSNGEIFLKGLKETFTDVQSLKQLIAVNYYDPTKFLKEFDDRNLNVMSVKDVVEFLLNCQDDEDEESYIDNLALCDITDNVQEFLQSLVSMINGNVDQIEEVSECQTLVAIKVGE